MATQSLKSPLKIGTRGSPLALYQARLVQRLIAEDHGLAASDWDETLPVVPMTTTGDKVQDRPLSAIGGKGLFTKEIEDALLDGRIDVAVHCVKDMPTECPPGLHLALTMEREDPRDAFISPKAARFEDLPEGAVVGSTSLRRRSQLLARRPDLKVVTYRGAVETRLRKLEEGEVDATLLAVAGLNRLGKQDVITSILDPKVMVPAVGQGALTLEVRESDAAVSAAIASLHHRPTEIEVAAERSFLAVLDGSCRTPIAGYASLSGETLTFHGRVLMPDGTEAHDIEATTTVQSPEEAARFGRAQGEALMAAAGEGFMTRLRAAVDAEAANPNQAPTR